MKKGIALLLCAAAALSLCACSSIYEKEYVVVEHYEPPAAPVQADTDRVTVRNFTALRQAVQNLVNKGRSQGSIVFDESYEGEPTEDMADACWQVRSQNALCAYCVDNISYEISTVLTEVEAVVSISYGDTGYSVEDIVRKAYTVGIDSTLEEALGAGQRQLVMLINHSTYSASQMEDYLLELYREAPLMSPKAPRFRVNMFSGTGLQRLYEVSIDYGMADSLRQSRMQELKELKLLEGLDTRRMSQAEKALALVQLMCDNMEYNPEGGNSVYDALVLGQGNSESLALGFVALARELGLEAGTVYGQYNWQEHCWNIIKLEDSYYHMDLSRCIQSGVDAGFLKNDMQMWASYRWDTAAYSVCDGPLSYESVVAASESVETDEGQGEAGEAETGEAGEAETGEAGAQAHLGESEADGGTQDGGTQARDSDGGADE